MTDRELVVRRLKKLTKAAHHEMSDFCYISIGTASVIVRLLEEQEEREKAICKEICDFIRGACSTDTDDDKDFVCYEIQRCFTHFGRSVKLE